jgi:putative ABC transport system permease protein
MLRVLLSRILGLFGQRRSADELDAEVQSHLDMLEERFIRQGMNSSDARHEARRQFGGFTQVKEDLREQCALLWVEACARDVRHAGRQLRRSKRFAVLAVLTLALGIGATTAVFAVLDAVVLRPLPYAEPDRLVAFRSLDRRGTPQPAQLSYPNFLDFRKANDVFEHLVSYRDTQFTLTGVQSALQVTGEIVSWDLFPLLGVPLEHGRGFLPEEERPGHHVVVLSHELWISRFAGDARVIGSAIAMNGRPFTVIGVTPEGFRFPILLPSAQMWVSLSEDAAGDRERGARMLDVIGRLKPGTSIEQARTRMDAVAGALARQYVDTNTQIATTWIEPELQRLTGDGQAPLWILLGAVILVLLIACATVAGLLLARSGERAREFAVRMALGASRSALVRQLLVESLILGLAGAACGVLLASVMLRAAVPLAGEGVPRLASATVDARVLAFSIGLAIVTSVLFGLAPALRATATDPASVSKESVRSIAPGHDRLRSGLVIGQVAIGIVLLVGSELLLASFLEVVRRDPGFRPDHLLTFEIGLSEPRYPVAQQILFSDRLLERLRTIPGVQAAATGSPLPLQGHVMRIGFDIEERRAPIQNRPRSDVAIVSPGYFAAMGIPLLKGRGFAQQDDDRAQPVVVINRALARKYFPGADPIGKRMQPGVGPRPIMRAIVGVVGDAKQVVLGTEPDPIYYLPYKQLPWNIGAIVLRTAGSPFEVEAAARAALEELDRDVPMHRVRSGDELSAMMIAPARFGTMTMTGFAAVALLLSVAGLYGVLSYMVARRRRELGVRIALGAGRGDVVRIVVRRAVILVATGLTVGSILALSLTRLLGGVISGVPDRIPAVAIACAVVVMTSSVAVLAPAWRAASIDPTRALEELRW